MNLTKKIHYKLANSFAIEAFLFWLRLKRHNASSNTDHCREKMEYTLLRENHIIEKGMSMRCPKIGFGQTKVAALCDRLIKYKQLYSSENQNFLKYPLATINHYINYTIQSGIDIPEIQSKFQTLSNGIFFDDIQISGIKSLSKKSIVRDFQSFSDFVQSRHSIRYFSRTPPTQEKLNIALQIAQQTPSACNRQGWKVHQFIGEKCTALLKWQGGANGFENEPTAAFLVTANLRAFLHYEPFQAYIDGGMFSMSLIYALHSIGLGTIPLSCGFHQYKLNKLQKTFNIPQNEVPIEIIAVGNLEEKFNVAVSQRKMIDETTIFH